MHHAGLCAIGIAALSSIAPIAVEAAEYNKTKLVSAAARSCLIRAQPGGLRLLPLRQGAAQAQDFAVKALVDNWLDSRQLTLTAFHLSEATGEVAGATFARRLDYSAHAIRESDASTGRYYRGRKFATVELDGSVAVDLEERTLSNRLSIRQELSGRGDHDPNLYAVAEVNIDRDLGARVLVRRADWEEAARMSDVARRVAEVSDALSVSRFEVALPAEETRSLWLETEAILTEEAARLVGNGEVSFDSATSGAP